MKKLTMALIIMTVMLYLGAETVSIGDNPNGVTIIDATVGNTILEYNCGSFEQSDIEIAGEIWNQVILPGEAVWQQAGAPGLPQVNRDVIIPGSSAMEVEILSSEYIELEMNVAPSKGLLSREINPADIDYSFGDVYSENKYFPAELADLSNPYIFRDYRGISVKINPFQYNGATGILRVYTHLELRIASAGLSSNNVKTGESAAINHEFAELYKRHFINYSLDRYDTIEEQAGRMVIISYSDFMDEMQPFIEWKNQKGIATTIVDVSSIGNSSTSIQNFITSEYEADDGLVWVLLVGDAAQVATKAYNGAGGDPQYTYLEGNDCYSEIFIGRFSAETAAQVETQVERSVYYERDVIDGDWMQRGIGIASSQGAGQGHYGEADYVHIGYIRDDLLDYGYLEVDEIYDTNGGNASMVSNAINEGRGIINYCGHGSNSSWVSTGFNISYVNALTNDYMLPFIQSIACVNGNFTNTTCFAEAWMRATNAGAPTGAVAIFASSINQSWAPPMYAQDESIDLMCDDALNTLGGLWFNGVSYMIDESNDISMAKTWHIFGDPSLQVRTMQPDELNVSSLPTIVMGQETFVVDTGMEGALACLTFEGEIISQGYSGADGNAYLFLGELPAEPAEMTLTVSGYNKITEVDEIQLVSAGGAHLQMVNYSVSAGGDDVLTAGEFAELGITVINIGTASAEDIEFIFTCDNEEITVLDGSEMVVNIDPTEMIELAEIFSFGISEETLNGLPVIFSITATSGDQTWTYTIGEMIEAESGLICESDEIDLVMGIDETDVFDLILKNNNYEGNLNYTIFIDETTGTRSIAGSTLTCNMGGFAAGETVDWTFTCANNSPDWEWIKDIVIDFPDGVTVNSAGDFIGGSEDLAFVGETGNGASCNWHGENSSGWGNLHNGETAAATVNVTIMPGFIGDIELSWELTGDGYASEPHQITGSVEILSNTDPINWLMTEILSGTLTPGEEIVHELNFNTAGLESGIYTADIMINSSENSLTIPVELFVDMGIIEYGDIDDNGEIDSFDSSLVLQYIVGLDPQGAPLPWEIWRSTRADVDGNGVVEAYDSGIILQYVVGIIEEFPVETGREHNAPYGSVDVRLNNDSGSCLEFYARGEVYSLEVKSRTHDFVLGEPEVSEGILSAYNNASDIYRYALAGFEPMNLEVTCLRIPVQGKIYRGELELTLKVNGYEYEETILLGDNGGVAPVVSVLSGNYPNPFNPETTIEYSLAEAGEVEISIYNIRGQHVKTLCRTRQDAGYHQIVWDGSDAAGQASSSGAYICLMRTSEGVQTRKMILLK
ncbi:MAG: T9SS type A sorting domain-containing protein [Candidatus Cloacimonetes bacterium]|nr:T9SS type A sorting domain-containing protein [Candidatus Cloacimonadota bacterium]